MTTARPDYQKSIDFLKKWSPEGIWVLTSIEVDKKGIETASFKAQDESSCLAWLQRNGERRNIYFHVNPTMKPLSKKAEREDIANMSWLHVDVDPRAGEDLAAERNRILQALQTPPGGMPKPSVVVFSGGGYQGFWRLSKPYPIDGNPVAYEEAKRYNQQIEILFGADNCHNVDRIMRLPGTLNRPDAKKRKKGRETVLAEVIEFNDTVFELSSFTQAPVLQGKDGGFTTPSRKINISGNIKRLSSVDELPDNVPDNVKVLIVQGMDPDDPAKWADRSRAVFYVACELVRAKVDDETIFSVLTDPDFKISGHVLDQKSGAERYTLRQIDRARQHAIDPMLEELNTKHMAIFDYGGKFVVCSETRDHALNRDTITIQSKDHFLSRYMNRYKEVGANADGQPIVKQLGKWWLEHENRREYEHMVFLPNHTIEGVYNLWRGFAYQAVPGDCSLYLAHMKDNLCNGDEEHYNYLLGWMAYAVQHPDQNGHTAVVFRGPQGAGKSFASQHFGKLWGRHFFTVSDSKHLVGNFNAHLRDCSVLFAEEAFFAGDKKHESILKSLITDQTMTTEAKGYDVQLGRNLLHIMMASNERWVVPANLDDRRFFVLDVGSKKVKDTNYFGAIDQQLRNGGYEALLHHLLTHDLSDFDVRKVPQTKALQEQKLYSMSSEEEWMLNKLKDGRLLEGHSDWEPAIFVNHLLDDYISYSRRFNFSRRGNSTRLGQFLARCCPPNYPVREQRNTPVRWNTEHGGEILVERPYFWVFPSLEVMRAHWDKNMGGPYDWTTTKNFTKSSMEPF